MEYTDLIKHRHSALGIGFTASIMRVLGILSGDSATAQEIKQISEFSQYQGTAKDLEIVPQLIPDNTSTAQNIPSQEDDKEELLVQHFIDVLMQQEIPEVGELNFGMVMVRM